MSYKYSVIYISYKEWHVHTAWSQGTCGFCFFLETHLLFRSTQCLFKFSTIQSTSPFSCTLRWAQLHRMEDWYRPHGNPIANPGSQFFHLPIGFSGSEPWPAMVATLWGAFCRASASQTSGHRRKSCSYVKVPGLVITKNGMQYHAMTATL